MGESGIGGDSGPPSFCRCVLLPLQGSLFWLARLLTEHMPRGGCQGGQEGDGTDKNVQRVGDANGNDGEVGSEKSRRGTQTRWSGV